MCGICGIIKFDNSPAEPEKIQKMMKVMKHRGPDDEGMFIEDKVGLGFVRLSIIDLSPLGHQPMFSGSKVTSNNVTRDKTLRQAQGDIHREVQNANGRFVIVYNGEVYNYIELREELKSKGYIFKSNTDTEVVLNSYIEWGEECLYKFNGMWALAIYDRKNKLLFCSRDRYGIKPFYYYYDSKHFIFASEIPPILSILNKKPTANNQTIFDYLTFNRTDQTEETFFDGIKKLQHGHTLKINLNHSPIQPYLKRWYDLREKVNQAEGFRSGEEFRDLFSSAVGLRLRSDVSVGVCLSGGLDSSSIVSVLLIDYGKNDLNTFSAVYNKGQSGDESEYINSFCTSGYSENKGNHLLHNMFFTTPSSETLYTDLNNFIKAHAEPIPSTSPYAQFKVMEIAKNNVVVTLDGQGADEYLAGYHYFFGFYFKDLLKNFRLFKLLKEAGYYLLNHRSLYGLKSFLFFLLPGSYRSGLRVSEKGYLINDFARHYYNNSVIADELYGSGSLQQALINHFEYKLEHLLKWEDRNSMWFSLEARVPFLDYRLVEKSLATDSSRIIKNGMTKSILRESMRGTLPEKIRLRKDKVGFGTPQDEWFRTTIFESLISEIFNSESFKKRNIIDVQKAKDLYKDHLNGKTDISKEIWKWINLELWFREFID